MFGADSFDTSALKRKSEFARLPGDSSEVSKKTKRLISKQDRREFFVSVRIFFGMICAACISPEAVKTDIQGIRNDMGQLESVVDQKADNSVVAEQIGEVNNRIEQTTQIAEELSVWRQSIQAETINYGGAGWVVMGTGLMALIFVGAGLLLVRAFMKRGNMLTLLTRAVQRVGLEDPRTILNIKKSLKLCVHEKGLCDQDRKNLGNFTKKKGTFVEQKEHS